ncbi:MAG: polyprenol monophosphomannose synthase [Candidatus Vogelbacteria bacterium]|nr:polyprenol monophosphomannose synthase [Candidatus Vogelbacteria bacterium]
MNITIVIPTYNERENIALLIPKLAGVVPEAKILVVDDNSPDGTGALVCDLMSEYRNLAILARPSKEGLGKAYIEAFKQVLVDQTTEVVIMMDADGSHGPQYLPAMLAKLNQAEVIVGSRYCVGGGTLGWELWRRALSFCGNIYCRMITGIPITDCTGGFNVISTRFLRQVNLAVMDMSGYAFIMELKYLLYKTGARFVEVPIIFRNRIGGESKLSGHIISEGIIAPLKMRFK